MTRTHECQVCAQPVAWRRIDVDADGTWSVATVDGLFSTSAWPAEPGSPRAAWSAFALGIPVDVEDGLPVLRRNAVGIGDIPLG